MPTKKPRVQSILEQEKYNKLKKICDLEVRSESQMINYIITKYIESYENEHGVIVPDEEEK